MTDSFQQLHPNQAAVKAIAVDGMGYRMNEGDMSDDRDIGLRQSQAESQQAVVALHGERADDDWTDDGWPQAGVEETDHRGAARVKVAEASPGSRDGDWTATTEGPS
jgi:hypothetical protein